MILVADSGSTKTDWRVTDGKNISSFQSPGINPFFQNENEIAEIIFQTFHPALKFHAIENIFFYGAGCANPSACKNVETALKKHFPATIIHVSSDLLGACRGLCGKEKGIVAILGTGSNSCFYDGEKIAEQIPSLGFILGDEGSGSHLGKNLLRKIFYDEMPENIQMNFSKQFNLTKDDVLDHVYRKPMPSRFLAGFAEFVSQYKDAAEIRELILNSFLDFFEAHICKYSMHKIVPTNFSGSVAFYFADELKKVAAEKNINIGKILQSPMEGLLSFHHNR